MKTLSSTEEFLSAMASKYESTDLDGAKRSEFLDILDLVKMLGCQYAVYVRRRPVPLAARRYEIIHNLPAGFDELCRSLTDNGDPGLRFWNVLPRKTQGSYWGWTVRMNSAARWDASLAGVSDRPLVDDPTSHALIFCTAHLAHWLFSKEAEKPANYCKKLSQREIEVLQWSGDGKTSADIAKLLSVSESTVNFHQKNIKEKLSCNTKTSSVVYAAMLGLLT